MQQSEQTGGILSEALGTFQAVFPTWLDHKYGYNPNTVYGPDQQSAYGFSPQDNTKNDIARSNQIFGDGSAALLKSPLVLGGGLLVGGLLALKAFKVI